jgi:hypothetical protein
MNDIEELEKAVDAFAEAMKIRLRTKQKQGWHGWKTVGKEQLGGRLLLNAANGAIKGDKKSLVDVANLAMFIHRNEK